MISKLRVKKSGFLNYIQHLFDIKTGTDKEGTLSNIKSNIPLKGANIWYLICSAIVASIGLNVNSPAIIIGAMLISPLMSPILGIGMSFGIHDDETLLLSVSNFFLAVLISLSVSTIYFLFTPLNGITSELLSRSKATILDVGVAIFGGMAGIVAISRSRETQVLPGAAIATALMPPICSAGFGLATGNYELFLGAIYLFFINAVFISASAYLVIRLLKFPYKVYLHKSNVVARKVIAGVILILMIIPSAFIFYDIILEVRQTKGIEKFINEKIKSDNRKVIEWKFNADDEQSELVIYTIGDLINNKNEDSLSKSLTQYNIENCKLNLVQIESSGATENHANELRADLLKTLERKMIQDENKSNKIENLENEISKVKLDSTLLLKIGEELKIIFPELETISVSKMQQNVLIDSLETLNNYIPVILQSWSTKAGTEYVKRNEGK
ncbi:MAG: DUF389 domain-containing protein, partial [Ignavibacteria bacterium]